MTVADVPRGEAGRWLPGRSPNPGGKPRKLREIEEMLDEEHRTVDNMREVFGRLKALAMGEVVTIVGKDGEVHLELEAHPGFMKLYLDRTLGETRTLSDERLEKLLEARLLDMLAEAEERKAQRKLQAVPK